jgi:glycosyltransferase involved in cell wall biosynthesis
MKHISVCIPTHGMKGLGPKFLRESLDKLTVQTFKDFEVVISDHSSDNLIEDVCSEYKGILDIQYYRNTQGIGSSSININNAIRKAKGKLIKILFLDDFLYHDRSLEDIAKNFDLKKDYWLVTACECTTDGITFCHSLFPSYNDKIFLGRNSISSPSVMTIKNDHPLLFDERLVWLMDVDYYKRCHDSFGLPKILNSINVVNRIGEHQGSGGYKIKGAMAAEQLKNDELKYVIRKYQRELTVKDRMWFIKTEIKYIIKRMMCFVTKYHG